MFKKVIFCVCAIFFAATTYAGEWTAPGKISGVYLDLRSSSERILFRHSASYVNPEDACREDKNYYELKADAKYTKEAYSMLLSAEATGKEIRIYLEGCSSTSWPVAVLVDGVM